MKSGGQYHSVLQRLGLSSRNGFLFPSLCSTRGLAVLRAVLFCSGVLLCAGCTRYLFPLFSVARFSAPVKPSFELSASNAVVYGRFGTGPDFAFGNELALRLCAENSKRVYLIRCRDKEPVYAIAVEPGAYRVEGFIGTFMDHRPAVRRNVPRSLVFTVQSNSATYLGDYFGFAKTDMINQVWGISGITNNYAVTTAELTIRYPNLKSSRTASMFVNEGALK